MKAARRLSCWLIALVFGPGSLAHAQDPSFQRTDYFAGLMACELDQVGLKGLTPLVSLSDLKNREGESVLVVLGDLSAHPEITSQFLRNFWRAGGALLLASDQNDQDRLKFCRLRISGLKVKQGYHPFVDDDPPPFEKQPSCPRLTDFPDRTHPLMRGLFSGLVTNCPSMLLSKKPSSLEKLAYFSSNCWAITGDDEAKFVHNERAVFLMAAASDGQRGPIIVLAGEGVFLDGMLASCQDNLAFALNCKRFLLSDGRRRHLVFINSGREVTSFDIPAAIDPKLPLPPMPMPTVRMVNRLLSDLEDRGVLQNLLNDTIPPSVGYRLLIGGFSLAAILCGAFWLSKSRWRVDDKIPRIVDPQPSPSASADTPGIRSLLAERAEALAALDNFAEPVQIQARLWFWRHAGISPMQWAEPGFAGPACRIDGTWWRRWTRARLIAKLGKLARDQASYTISSRQYRQLQSQFAELTFWLQTGQISWEK